MRGFHHATILSSSFHGVRKERLAQWPPISDPKTTKMPRGGGTFRKIGWGCATRFLKPLPYFRPKSVIFLTLFQTWSKIWYPISELKPWSPALDKLLRHVHGSWRKHWKGMVLSPNDEEVANSSKNIPNSKLECTNHTLLQTKTAEKNIAYIRDSARDEKRVADY